MAAAPMRMPLGTTTDLSAPGTWETTRSIIFLLGGCPFVYASTYKLALGPRAYAKLYGTNLLPYPGATVRLKLYPKGREPRATRGKAVRGGEGRVPGRE